MFLQGKIIMMWFCCLLFLSMCVVTALAIPENYKYDECPPNKEKCVYWLTVEEKLTMMWGKWLVYPHGGKLYKLGESYTTNTSEVPIDEVVSVDGVKRMVVTVNDTIPGPPIIVYESQEVIVHIKNNLLSDSLTIHWHGIHQKGTPYMDGVGYITQCPIAAGQTFTYRFKANPKGTFWYHSHIGAQRTNGIFGAFIIKERKTQATVDVIMTVMDWHHDSSEEVYQKMLYGNFNKTRKYDTTKTLDGGMFSDVPWVSGLIEGRGRYKDPATGEIEMTPLTWYNVTKGTTYKFRVIHAGSIYPLRISVDQHSTTVVASDGYDLKPTEVESFIINPGERFDFLLKADQLSGNYWIRANSMEADEDHTIQAVLHYEGATENEPTTDRVHCTKAVPCKVINCPFRYFPVRWNMKCILLSDLKSLNDEAPPVFQKGSHEYFLNFAFPGNTVTPGSVNGRQFSFPGVNSLTQEREIELGDYHCSKHDCGVDKLCECHYQIHLPFDKTIQMVWLNIGSGAGWAHPIHLHGHSFYVLKMVYPPQNKRTGKLIGKVGGRKGNESDQYAQSEDINCGGTALNFCNDAKWKNGSWQNGNIPGLNLKNPPRKDTLIIPTGGYVVIRIRSNNPGKWFLHCHIEVHALNGMAMVMSEAVKKANKPPKGFPVCQNFYDDTSRDISYMSEDECVQRKWKIIGIFFIVLFVVAFLVVMILAYVVYQMRRRYAIMCEVH